LVFSEQGLVFGKQGIDVGGDPSRLGSRRPLARIKPHQLASRVSTVNGREPRDEGLQRGLGYGRRRNDHPRRRGHHAPVRR